MAHWVHGFHSVRFAQLLFSRQNVSEAGWISAERMFLDSACPLVWLRKSKKCQEDPPDAHQDTVQLDVLGLQVTETPFHLPVMSTSQHGDFLSGQFHSYDGMLRNGSGS